MRRFALRNLRSDEGFGLIETVAALLVFGLIMSGLAASMAVYAHNTALTRARASASALAQQYVEKARAVGATNLVTCDNQTPAPPATASFRGTAGFTVLHGPDATCIPYQKTGFQQDGLTFSVTRLVLQNPNALPQKDVSDQLQSEKYLVVQVSWTDAGGATKTYELDTIINQKGANTAPPAQGIRMLVEDTSGNMIVSDNANWAVKITGPNGATTLMTDPDAQTAEGTYYQIDLTPGAYTCSLTTSDDSSSGYSPASATYNPSPLTISSSTGDPAANDTISGPCSVQAGVVTDFVAKWTTFPDCATTGSGTLTLSAFQSDDTTPVPTNMTLAVTNVTTGVKTTSTAVSHSFGVPAGWYTYSVADPAGTWQTAQNSYGPVCVVNKLTQALKVDMTPLGNCAPGTTTNAATALSVTVLDTSTTPDTPLSGFKVIATDISVTPNTVTNFKNTTNASGVTTQTSLKPGLYTFTVTPPNGSPYQGSGVQGPTCVAFNSTNTQSVSLSTQSCTRNDGDKTATLAFTVVDQTGFKVVGATLKLTNVNTGQTVSATTDNNGKKSVGNLAVDPWQYNVIGPNGNYLDSGVTGPVCTAHNATYNVATVTLTGLMNVSVTVNNRDSLPWKNYQITVSQWQPDPNNPSNNVLQVLQTQYVTVPDCGYNGTPACSNNPTPTPLTFSGLVTGSGYVLQVCAQLKTNCNVVDTAPADPNMTFNFPQPLTTYTQTTSAPAYAELALIDDSGGW